MGFDRKIVWSSTILFTLGVFTAMPAISAETLVGEKAFGDWQNDAPGVRRHIRIEDLPAPFVTPSASNRSDKAKRGDQDTLKAPEGFTVDLVASGFKTPRIIRTAPNGDLFVADSKAGEVHVLRLPDGSSKVESKHVFARNLHQPYGIAFWPPGPEPQWVYIANSDSVVRFPYRNGDVASDAEPQIMVDKIPSTHHWTRDIVFSADGKTMFISVGSGSNVALDMSPQPMDDPAKWRKEHPLGATWDTEERRADVLAFDPDGRNERIFATGLRNCSGMAMQPATQHLWCVVNERDELGDNVPFEYATRVQEGRFYGWPWYYNGDHEDPRHAGKRPDLKDKVTVPDVLFQAHSAPLGVTFYDGKDFPAEYRGDAFVAFHGSWNRGKKTGYKIVRMLFNDGKPTGAYEDFITGFVVSDAQVWGRPVGIAVARDGSLLFTEDGGGTIWRVAYDKKGST